MTRLANYTVMAALLAGNLVCWLLAVWGFRELLGVAS